MQRFCLGLFLFAICTLPALELSAQEVDWKNELDYLVSELKKRHPNPFTVISEKDFDANVVQLQQRISDLSGKEATFELMELVASIGDGHTLVAPDSSSFRFFPINVRWFEDGVYVRAIDRKHKDLVGSKLVAVGDTPVDEIVERFKKFLSHDNDWGIRKLVDKQFQTVEYLERANVLDDEETATFHFEPGSKKQSVKFKAIKPADSRKVRFINPYGAGLMKKSIFLDLLIKDEHGMPFWNEWIPEHKLVYFKYNQCRNSEGFAKFVNDTAAFIAENDVEKFVLDIRDNAGGSALVFRPLLQYLLDNKDLNQKGKLFVMVGRDTFSSAMFAACEMRQTNAIFVGEPTGARPNHFGEVKTFKLPGSGLVVYHSTKYFTLEEKDSDTFEPEIRIRYTAKDSFAAHDQALQAVFDYEEE